MKQHPISYYVLLSLLTAVSAQTIRKCCPPSQAIVQINSTLQCQSNFNKRIQTNFQNNNFVSKKIPGSCVDVFEVNKTAIFNLDEQGTITKRQDLKTDFYPKCCHLGHVYNDTLHSCQISNNSSIAERSIPPDTFIFVGLPTCEVISDLFVSSLEELRWSGRHLTVKKDDRKLEEGKFCVDSTNSRFVVRICENLEVCEKIRCIRKCCQDGQSFVNGSKCKDTFRYGMNLKSSRHIEEPDVPFAIIHGIDRPIYILKDSKDFKIDKSGTLLMYTNTTDSYNRYEYSEKVYCLEHAYKKGRVNDYTIFARTIQPQLKIKFAVTRWVKIISCFFLFLTMAVYMILPKMLNLFGKILLSYSFATFLFFFFLCLSQFLSTQYDDVVCKTMGFLTIMASFWSFTWLNIMCIDIWVSFGTARTYSGRLQRNELKKLIQYNVYGWGVPLVWVTIIALFNSTKILPEAIYPYVGFKKCYMENSGDQPGNYAYNIFITMPVLFQQIANIVLFVKTLNYCLKIRGEIQKMNESSKKSYRVGKEELNLVMKLAVIMGVSFLFETASSMYDFSKSPATSNIEVVWDTINCLQGVFIFMVFICKRKILNNLLEKMNIRNPNKYDVTSSMATQESLHTNSTRRETMSLR